MATKPSAGSSPGILGSALSYLTGSGAGSQAIRGILGGYLANRLSPRPNIPAPITAQQLNAATLPLMQKRANRRMAYLQGAQGAKGGLSSADMYQQNDLQTQLSQRLSQQQALNLIQANQQAASYANAKYNSKYRTLQDTLSGGIAAANLFT